jgi:catechol 2,3-dioxygenase-like lactoylglutathione lyase family enzyme
MTHFEQVTPFLHVPDLQKALDFFTDILGFTVPFRQPGYAYIHRETVGFRLLEGPAGEIGPGRRRFAYYIDVSDVDALYAELKPRLDTLPPDDVHGPADKPYGQRELLVLAPDGELIVFGMAVSDSGG